MVVNPRHCVITQFVVPELFSALGANRNSEHLIWNGSLAQLPRHPGVHIDGYRVLAR